MRTAAEFLVKQELNHIDLQYKRQLERLLKSAPERVKIRPQDIKPVKHEIQERLSFIYNQVK